MESTPVATQRRPPSRLLIAVALLAPALLTGLLTTLGPFRMDPVAMWGGVGLGHHPGALGGYPDIEPNMGTTAFALGLRAALDLLAGRLPLWNHFEGLGTPLLGEMQSAAFFPFTALLLFPYGQAIEQSALQAVAGLGTYLFLRRFGLRTTAALAGAVLFEFNGVFAWLRNAIYNPVAFLPWLLYAVESLFHGARVPAASRADRARPIAIGAIAAALALYAGFPEVVYFYSLLVAAWAALRVTALPPRRALAFAAGLLAIAVLALLIAGPLLIAFAHFLAEAVVGGHQGDGFRLHVLPAPAFLLTMLPYAFGTIAAAPNPAVAAIWGDIGGYLGLVPLLLAAAGALCTWRARTTWLLVAWIVLAIGASHGVPVLHSLFTALPLATIAAYSRYLDAAWIFAAIILAACFLDRVDAVAPTRRRRLAAGACAIAAALLALGLAVAAPILADLLRTPGPQRGVVLASLAAALVLPVLFWLALRRRSPAAALAALAALEAAACFLLPLSAVPKFSGIDRPLIDFLRTHAGLQRFAIGSGGGLAPNFGSVFAIPAMNYDDLPTPARTARFVTTRLDATNDGAIFAHDTPIHDPAERRAARARFHAAAPGYQAAGVRYVLSDEDVAAEPAYPVAAAPQAALALHAGDALALDLPPPAAPRTVATVSLLIGTYGGLADGTLHVRLCQAGRCADGTAPLLAAPDNRGLLVHLGTPLALAADAPLRVVMTKEGGRHEVALWLRPGPADIRLSGLDAPPGFRPVLDWIAPGDLTPVLRTATTTVLEFAHPRPYASAPGCRLDIADQDHLRAHCAAPSRLLRLEVAMTGWHAAVNGAETPILPAEDTFQSIDLPAGDAEIVFTYAPRFLRPAIPVALLALALCLATILVPAATGRQGR